MLNNVTWVDMNIIRYYSLIYAYFYWSLSCLRNYFKTNVDKVAFLTRGKREGGKVSLAPGLELGVRKRTLATLALKLF